MLCEGEGGGGGEEVRNWILVDGVRKVLFFGGGNAEVLPHWLWGVSVERVRKTAL